MRSKTKIIYKWNKFKQDWQVTYPAGGRAAANFILWRVGLYSPKDLSYSYDPCGTLLEELESRGVNIKTFRIEVEVEQ